MIFENSVMNGSDPDPPQADCDLTQLDRPWTGGKKKGRPLSGAAL